MQDVAETPEHRIDREIYGMPAFTTLEVTDLQGAQAWYEDLGFVLLADLREFAGLLHLRRYRYQDLLLVRADRVPSGFGSGVRTAFAHTGPRQELDAVAGALGRHDAGEVEGPSRPRGTPSTSSRPTPTGTS